MMNLQDNTLKMQNAVVELEKDKLDKYANKSSFSDLIISLRKRGLSDTEIMQTAYWIGIEHGKRSSDNEI